MESRKEENEIWRKPLQVYIPASLFTKLGLYGTSIIAKSAEF
jgi:hypothetical protein